MGALDKLQEKVDALNDNQRNHFNELIRTFEFIYGTNNVFYQLKSAPNGNSSVRICFLTKGFFCKKKRKVNFSNTTLDKNYKQ